MPTIVRRLIRGEKSSLNVNTGWTYEYIYFVAGDAMTNESARTAVDSVSGLAVPAIQSTHPENSALVVQSVDVGERTTTVEYGVGYEVYVKYFTPVITGELDGNEGIQYKWSPFQYQEQVDADLDGNPFINAAGDPLMSTYSDTLTGLMLEVERNEPIYSPTVGFLRSNSVNREEMQLFGTWSIDKEQMLCEIVAPKSSLRLGGSTRVRVYYRFLFKDGYLPWQPHARNIGFNGWFDDGETRKKGDLRLKSSPSTAVTTAVNLDSGGMPILDAEYVVGAGQKNPANSPQDVIDAQEANNSQGVPRVRFYQPENGSFREVIFTRKRLVDFRGTIPGIM